MLNIVAVLGAGETLKRLYLVQSFNFLGYMLKLTVGSNPSHFLLPGLRSLVLHFHAFLA